MPTVLVDSKSFAKPLENLRHTLASTAKYQEVTSTVSVAAAKLTIYYFWADKSAPRPRSSIRNSDEVDIDRFGIGGFKKSGPIMLFIELPIPTLYQDNHEDAGLDFLNKLGLIFDEMQTLVVADPSQYLNITNIRLGNHGEVDKKISGGQRLWGAETMVEWKGM